VVAAETVERLAAHDLDSALDQLPEQQRHAVLLCDLWGFCYAEIADITSTPVGTVRSRISRGRAALSGVLAGGRRSGRKSRGQP